MTMWALGRFADALQFEIAHDLRTVRAARERKVALLRAFTETSSG